jgi:hypothetical protein
LKKLKKEPKLEERIVLDKMLEEGTAFTVETDLENLLISFRFNPEFDKVAAEYTRKIFGRARTVLYKKYIVALTLFTSFIEEGTLETLSDKEVIKFLHTEVSELNHNTPFDVIVKSLERNSIPTSRHFDTVLTLINNKFNNKEKIDV